MIRIEVDDATLQTIRLTYSPLWEAVGSLGILARYRGEAPSPYTRWSYVVRSRLPADLIGDLVESLRRGGPFPPDGLPMPDPSRPTFLAELEHLRATRWWDDRLIKQLSRYWDWALAPYWTSVRTPLEEEILFRGRTLAVQGPEAMLGELGGRVLWSPPQLTAPYHRELKLSVARSQLLLVPTMFAGGLRLFRHADSRVAMSYQARATGYFDAVISHVRDQKAERRLELLLGRGRAQVVLALQGPKTTTAIADALGLAKSTVSQHLTVLTDTGLVWKQRLGGRVFYQLDNAGVALLRQLGF